MSYSKEFLRILWLICLGTLFFSCSRDVPKEVEQAYAKLPETVDFNFHVKPILSDRCFACHGPDEASRQAGLRLDLEEEAFKELESGNHAFVAGKPGKSETIIRILSDDPEMVMPPPESHLSLTAIEKATIIKWIEQGAQWKAHWAFSKPEKQNAPKIQGTDYPVHNPIDAFVQKILVQKGFTPSPEAKKEQLLRRVTMDLTGLPPTLEEIDSFLNDSDPNAYENVVDGLLSSDANAERLALDWMDLARYADSHGLHADGWRSMWPWRDWVINAFRQNMPYDQFVTWQLAGDLMPNPTKEQKLATAFNRNHPMTAEGGAIEEEFRLNYVWDRTETVGTALLGLTVACARCHDHKFDPISQKDYFQMTAFFNNIREIGMTGDDGNYGPMLTLPEPETEQKLDSLQKSIQQQEEQLALTKKELRDLDVYLKKLPSNFSKKGLIGHYPLDRITARPNKKGNHLVDGNPKVTSRTATKITKGIWGNALEFTGEYDEIYLRDVPNFEWTDKFSASLWLNTTKRQAGKTQTLLGTSSEKNSFWRGWDFYLDSLNRLNARLINTLPHNMIHVRSKDSVKTNQWYHVGFTYDGSGRGQGLNLYTNGEKVKSDVIYDKLYKSIKSIRYDVEVVLEKKPVRVAKSYRAFTGENGIFKGQLDEIHVYGRELVPLEVNYLAKKGTKSENRDNHEATDYWVNQSPEVKEIEKQLKKLRSEWLSLMEPVLEVMVMEEMSKKRTAFAYDRGDYSQPIYEVTANTPEILPDFPEDYPQNRLGLAQWIFSEKNPLTARVTVNRYWQMIFGQGLVNTPEDFGVQGALPTHPELLDWLAVSFVESNWDVKALLKTMVMSHTYRQSSQVTDEMHEKDPNNHYLARANSYRLPAEFIRDNALAASGLLVNHIGGESVKPYQPEGLWIEKNSFSKKLLTYKESEGEGLYRRGLYTFIRRTAPHPAMTAFDAPSREVCTVKRENTNTPLQALVLMNDVQFVEASKMLAARMQKEAGDSLEDQIAHGFRLAVSRSPKQEETEILKDLFAKQLNRFRESPKEATNLLGIGKKELDNSLDKTKTAALTMVANTILNHDETYMKR